MFEVKTAQDATDAALSAAMADAFSDYDIPLQLDEAAFAFMMRQRGLDRDASTIATIDGEIVAIWLTSVRHNRGYLISSGTRPRCRAQGIARALATACLDGLRARGVGSYETEVLRRNAAAAGLYRSLGMTTARGLDCYVVPAARVLMDAVEGVEDVVWRDIAPQAKGLRDWAPSWQNADAALDAIADDLRCFAVREGAQVVGYSVVNPGTGAVFQLAVGKGHRRRGLGRALVHHVQATLPGKALRFINMDQGDPGMRGFMTGVGAVETAGQFELKMPLSDTSGR